jgi:HSP20 family molecular chaperone IbpA
MSQNNIRKNLASIYDELFGIAMEPIDKTKNLWGPHYDKIVGRIEPFLPRGDFPLMNLKETETGFEFHLQTPGYSKGELALYEHDDFLIIKGNHITDGSVFCRKEFEQKKFTKKIPIPCNAKIESLKCKYENGILVITFDKVIEVVEEMRKINIE